MNLCTLCSSEFHLLVAYVLLIRCVPNLIFYHCLNALSYVKYLRYNSFFMGEKSIEILYFLLDYSAVILEEDDL